MKKQTQSGIVFFGKSLLWAALLYCALMLVFNWGDITSSPKANTVSFITSPKPAPKVQATGQSVYTVLSTIAGYIVTLLGH